MPVRLGLLALVAALVAGCGGGPRTFASAQEAYEQGVEAFKAEKYGRAIESFRATLDFGRTSDIADDAQILLARSYAGDGQYLLAGTEFTRFIEFYRADPRVEEAAFERIQAYAALSPRFELDQTDTRQALTYIALFLQQYPTGEYAVAASELADELREKLARKQFESGRLYERRELYGAAVIAYLTVLDEYPTSVYADDALLSALRAQVAFAEGSVPARQEERYREATDIYDQLTTLFPQSETLGEAQAFYDRAYQGWRAAGGEPISTRQ
ncbi:outer membrane protein assembly factor BamD [Rubrivirga sp. S365]|uniref:Outer membrane protein assembly factor BamD n=1 Tax=Rubrivirga litoralis TaxID=3075598 RepID=A0ABU3BNY8_9BACT|nr:MULTISPECIES: outer membrane protein assembly factor BamD [unclassified Rubrivirga]MDT0631003.1 outer membrane protein assembly factor BamD [Rubrivirga sp. F394]MDT7855029.1 outer membrane protein assembly factor BamD [Rubrivirga sp. S365]